MYAGDIKTEMQGFLVIEMIFSVVFSIIAIKYNASEKQFQQLLNLRKTKIRSLEKFLSVIDVTVLLSRVSLLARFLCPPEVKIPILKG